MIPLLSLETLEERRERNTGAYMRIEGELTKTEVP